MMRLSLYWNTGDLIKLVIPLAIREREIGRRCLPFCRKCRDKSAENLMVHKNSFCYPCARISHLSY